MAASVLARRRPRAAAAVLRLSALIIGCGMGVAVASAGGDRARDDVAVRASTLGLLAGAAGSTQAAVADPATVAVADPAVAASPALQALPTSATPSGDLPPAALGAYLRAAQVIGSVRPGCGLTWPLIAAVGQVQSDHGRSVGGLVRPDGTSTVPVRGVVLDGADGRARVRDTDGGDLDGNATWDRAVGPMQFLPSTWIAVRVDGDGDGVRSPDDIDDAALAAAVFLCAEGDDLSQASGAQRALGRFNPTPGFAATVLSLARAYGSATYLGFPWSALGALPEAGTPFALAAIATVGSVPVVDETTSTAEPSTTPAVAPTPTPTTTPATPPTTPVPAPSGPTSGTPTATPGATTTGTPDGSRDGAPTPSPAPSPGTSATADPTPTATAGPDAPAPSAAEASTTSVSGILVTCGDQRFCLDDRVLDFGALDSIARADVDGDGSIATKQGELAGLLGEQVTVTVSGVVVVTLQEQPW